MNIPIVPQQNSSYYEDPEPKSFSNLWGLIPSGKVTYGNMFPQAPQASTTAPVPAGSVGGYDIANGWNAADPNHLSNVQSIYNQLKSSTSTDPVQDDITRVSGLQGSRSPLTSEMINSSSEKYGVDPYMTAAAIRADTSYGIHTLTPNNPSNVGTYGKTKTQFKNWQQGVDETARFLSTIKVGNQRTFKGLADQ